MKHLSTLLFAVLGSFSFAQNGQLTNGGFENWFNDTMYQNPQTWQSANTVQYFGTPTVVRSSDAQDGSSSVELRSVLIGQDTTAGFVFHGDPSLTSGIPYTANFEAVTFQYKSNLQFGDTLYMILIRYNGGSAVDFQTIPAAYGTTNVWTPNLLYVGNLIIDEIFIGFTLDVAGGNMAAPGSWARVDNVQLIAGGSAVTPLPNPSFEIWDTETVEEAEDWYSLNWFLGGFGLENTTKTTDAYAGNYAVQMNTIFGDPDTIASIISLAPIELFSANPFNNVPYNASPTLFSGAYKYIANNGDQGGISITFLQAGVPIGIHNELFSNQASYTTFASPLTIVGTPDSISFVVYSGNNPGSVLKLDELQFSGGGVGIFEQNLPEFAVFPNPAQQDVQIVLPTDGSYQLSIYGVDGRLIYQELAASGTVYLQLDDFRKGVYSIVMSDGKSQRIQKLIVN